VGGTSADRRVLPRDAAREKTSFRDITVGQDGATQHAGTGSDDVTGLGSPLAERLVPALAKD
jgi:hypothetical protein